LGDLALVVREDVVLASRVDVEDLPQVLPAHGGALDVPPREAAAEGRVPLHEVLRVPLPEGEVEGTPLRGVRLDAMPLDELLRCVPAQDPVAGELRDLEVDLAARLVGEPLLE